MLRLTLTSHQPQALSSFSIGLYKAFGYNLGYNLDQSIKPTLINLLTIFEFQIAQHCIRYGVLYASMYQWAYGLKTKDEANATVQKWTADIADIIDRHKLEITIRDNVSELKSKDLTDHLESLGFKNC